MLLSCVDDGFEWDQQEAFPCRQVTNIIHLYGANQTNITIHVRIIGVPAAAAAAAVAGGSDH